MGLKKEQLSAAVILKYRHTAQHPWRVILILVTVFRLKVKIYGLESHSRGGWFNAA